MEDILVPIVLFLMPVFIVWIVSFFNSKHEQRIHQERMLSIEKGIEPPAWPEKKKSPAHVGFRNAGIIVSFFGVAIFVATAVNADMTAALSTLVILLVGVSFLVISYLMKKEEKVQD